MGWKRGVARGSGKYTNGRRPSASGGRTAVSKLKSNLRSQLHSGKTDGSKAGSLGSVIAKGKSRPSPRQDSMGGTVISTSKAMHKGYSKTISTGMVGNKSAIVVVRTSNRKLSSDKSVRTKIKRGWKKLNQQVK